MKNTVLILLLLCSVLSLFGQHQLTGNVIVKGTEKPIADAIVLVDESDSYEITNVNGDFSFHDLNAGTYKIRVISTGFKPKQMEVVLPTDQSLTFELVEEIIGLEEVTVNGIANHSGIVGSLDLPPSTSYLSKKELEQVNSTDINKILYLVPGVNFQEEDGFGLRPNIGLRGSGVERSSKVTIMEDGVLAAPAPYAAPSAYYFPTVGRMAAMEIRKGNSQIEYGPFTTGGSINFYSTPIPERFQANLRGNLGAFTTGDFQGNVGGQVGQFSYLVETFQYGSNGFKDLPSDQSTGFTKQDYLAKVAWENASSSRVRHRLQLKAGFAFENSNETYLGLSQQDFQQDAFARYAGSKEDNMDTEHQQFVLTHTVAPSKTLTIKTSLYNNNFSRNWYKLDKVRDLEGNKVGITSLLQSPEDYSEEMLLLRGAMNSGQAAVLDVKANNREYYSRGIQTKVNWSVKENQSLTAGARLHQDEMDRFQWVDGYSINDQALSLQTIGVPGTESNRIEQADAISAYTSYRVSFNQLTITPGIRYENIEISRDNFGVEDPERSGVELTSRSNRIEQWIPGVGFQYEINNDHQLFAGIHKGFAPPGSTPETDAEESVNYELGYRFSEKNTFVNATLFYNDYTNLLGADNASAGGTGTGNLYNGGEARTFGLELGAHHDLILNQKLHFPISVAYTYTNAEFDSTFDSDFDAWGTVNQGDQLPYLAPHQVNTNFGVKSQRFSTFLRANFMDNMRIRPGQGELTNQNSIDGRMLLHADAQLLVNKRLSILARINNILNETYVVSERPSGLRPGMPRAMSLGFDLRFH